MGLRYHSRASEWIEIASAFQMENKFRGEAKNSSSNLYRGVDMIPKMIYDATRRPVAIAYFDSKTGLIIGVKESGFTEEERKLMRNSPDWSKS